MAIDWGTITKRLFRASAREASRTKAEAQIGRMTFATAFKPFVTKGVIRATPKQQALARKIDKLMGPAAASKPSIRDPVEKSIRRKIIRLHEKLGMRSVGHK